MAEIAFAQSASDHVHCPRARAPGDDCGTSWLILPAVPHGAQAPACKGMGFTHTPMCIGSIKIYTIGLNAKGAGRNIVGVGRKLAECTLISGSGLCPIPTDCAVVFGSNLCSETLLIVPRTIVLLNSHSLPPPPLPPSVRLGHVC